MHPRSKSAAVPVSVGCSTPFGDIDECTLVCRDECTLSVVLCSTPFGDIVNALDASLIHRAQRLSATLMNAPVSPTTTVLNEAVDERGNCLLLLNAFRRH